MIDTIIEYDKVKKSFGDNVVIPEFSLTIEKGDFVTIIGSSGCGKTTIMKMINGLVLPDEGSVYVEGQDIMSKDLIQLRRNIGYAIQGSGLFPHMTVEKNIAYVPELLNKKDKQKTKNAVLKWAELLGLTEGMLLRYPEDLSGGQQQRVGIARSLAASPDILLMDEPFGAVDEITKHTLQDEIKRIHDDWDVTIVFITHDINEAIKLGTKMLVMDKGQVLQYDAPDKIEAYPATPYVEELIGAKDN